MASAKTVERVNAAIQAAYDGKARRGTLSELARIFLDGRHDPEQHRFYKGPGDLRATLLDAVSFGAVRCLCERYRNRQPVLDIRPRAESRRREKVHR